MPRIVDHGERRSEVVRALHRTIARGGFEAASMREIASAAGCTTGVLTHYFRDKQEILLHALRFAHHAAARRMAAAMVGRAPLNALRSVLLEALPLDEDRRIEWRIWVSFWGRCVADEELVAELRERTREWQELVSGLLVAARESGDLDGRLQVREVADELLALVDGLGLRATLLPEGMPLRHMVRSIDRRLAEIARVRVAERAGRVR